MCMSQDPTTLFRSQRTIGSPVIMSTSGAYILQENTSIDGQIITSGELVVKEKYLYYMQVDTNLILGSASPTACHHSANTHNTLSTT